MDSQLSLIAPQSKRLVFDLLQETGFDLTDWVESSNSSTAYKANPKYCYEWAFHEPKKFIVLNLWHEGLKRNEAAITAEGNFRIDANHYRNDLKKSTWSRRAFQADKAIQKALSDNLAVRVILLLSQRRATNLPVSVASEVRFRDLDVEPWTITKYIWETGEYEVTRGILSTEFVDQFDLAQAATSLPTKVSIETTSFVRDPEVRRRVLRRASGTCELCGVRGFKMANGALYLETHHVVPLSEDGSDQMSNVVAICANDHRRAHFGAERDVIRETLRQKLLAYYQIEAS